VCRVNNAAFEQFMYLLVCGPGPIMHNWFSPARRVSRLELHPQPCSSIDHCSAAPHRFGPGLILDFDFADDRTLRSCNCEDQVRRLAILDRPVSVWEPVPIRAHPWRVGWGLHPPVDGPSSPPSVARAPHPPRSWPRPGPTSAQASPVAGPRGSLVACPRDPGTYQAPCPGVPKPGWPRPNRP